MVPDPAAKKPDDWDDEEDGDFEAPQITNPKCKTGHCGEWKRPEKKNPQYKGKWVCPKIDNPEYKGEWAPKQIENPNFFEDKEPHKMVRNYLQSECKPVGHCSVYAFNLACLLVGPHRCCCYRGLDDVQGHAV